VIWAYLNLNIVVFALKAEVFLQLPKGKSIEDMFKIANRKLVKA